MEPKLDFSAIRFRIDRVSHPVYQVPAVVMIAMTARIKLLGGWISLKNVVHTIGALKH